MKTLEIKGDAECGNLETCLHNDKSAREVIREQYHDNCVLKPVTQPKSTRTSVTRPTTYIVEDRTDLGGREDVGEPVGTLVELP